jgi:Bacterial Ig-like domain (group 2)
MFTTTRHHSSRIGTVSGALIILLIGIVNVGCGGLTGRKPTSAVSVQVTPSTASLQPGSTQQFSATVTGGSSSTVTWSANGGTISGAGLYNAPSAPGTYTIQATSATDNSKLGSATVTVIGTSTSPSSVVAGTTHSVGLSWAASTSSVVGYFVYRGTTAGGPYTKLFTSAEAATVYTDNSVQNGATYYYVVSAVDGNGAESGFSNQASATVPAS